MIPTAVAGICLYLSVSAYLKYTENYTKTYVTSHQIAQRTLISEKDLKEVEVPKEFLSDDVYLKKRMFLASMSVFHILIPRVRYSIRVHWKLISRILLIRFC